MITISITAGTEERSVVTWANEVLLYGSSATVRVECCPDHYYYFGVAVVVRQRSAAYEVHIIKFTAVLIPPEFISFVPCRDLIGSCKRWLTAHFVDRTDPRLAVCPMLVCAQCIKGQHRARSWFAHGPVVVSSLPIQSSPAVYSQCTACSLWISPDLIKFLGIIPKSGYAFTQGQPDLRQSAAANCTWL